MIFLISQINGIDFQFKGYLNLGVGAPGVDGLLLIADTDRDSLFELIFPHQPYSFRSATIWEQLPSNPFQFEFQAAIGAHTAPWFIGDYDLDGLYEVVCEAPFSSSGLTLGITFFEQPDSFYYPVVEIWRDTTSHSTTAYASGDADNDGLPDILGNDEKLFVYETRGNNLFERVFEDTFPSQDPYGGGKSSPMDYDGDGKKEFVIGGGAWRVFVAENKENDIYCFIWKSPLLYTTNTFDVKSLPDLDHDGKNEFMVKGWVYPIATVHCYIFEAQGK